MMPTEQRRLFLRTSALGAIKQIEEILTAERRLQDGGGDPPLPKAPAPIRRALQRLHTAADKAYSIISMVAITEQEKNSRPREGG